MKLTGSNWFTGVGLLTVAFLKLCFSGYSLDQTFHRSPLISWLESISLVASIQVTKQWKKAGLLSILIANVHITLCIRPGPRG